MLNYVKEIKDGRYIVDFGGELKSVTRKGVYRLPRQRDFIGVNKDFDIIEVIPNEFFLKLAKEVFTKNEQDNGSTIRKRDKRRFKFEKTCVEIADGTGCLVTVYDKLFEREIFRHLFNFGSRCNKSKVTSMVKLVECDYLGLECIGDVIIRTNTFKIAYREPNNVIRIMVLSVPVDFSFILYAEESFDGYDTRFEVCYNNTYKLADISREVELEYHKNIYKLTDLAKYEKRTCF